jgi:DUF1016 N-terminal domain
MKPHRHHALARSMWLPRERKSLLVAISARRPVQSHTSLDRAQPSAISIGCFSEHLPCPRIAAPAIRDSTSFWVSESLVDGLSERLRAEFGKGYDRSNVFHMRAFFLAYPKVDALRRQLSWTHYRLLLRVDNADARAFYEVEASMPGGQPARWSGRSIRF